MLKVHGKKFSRRMKLSNCIALGNVNFSEGTVINNEEVQDTTQHSG